MNIIVKNALFTSIANARETLISLRYVMKDDITKEIFDILRENGFKGDETYDFVSDELLDYQLKNIEKRFADLFAEYQTFFQMTYTNVKNYDEDLLKSTFFTDIEKNADKTYNINIYFAIYREDDYYDGTCSNYTYEFEQSYSFRTAD